MENIIDGIDIDKFIDILVLKTKNGKIEWEYGSWGSGLDYYRTNINGVEIYFYYNDNSLYGPFKNLVYLNDNRKLYEIVEETENKKRMERDRQKQKEIKILRKFMAS